jgi:hypothetical protein
MTTGVKALTVLAKMGFSAWVEGKEICLRYEGPGKPDPGQVRPLLALVKEHKPEVLAYLSRPIPPERILTCYECGHFRPAVNSPNPTQALGHCRKRGRGRYGAATACEAIMTAPEATGEVIYSKPGQEKRTEKRGEQP